MKTIIRTALAGLLAVSCSIKEDRSACPCIIHMDYTLARGDERIVTDNSRDSILVIMRGLYNGIDRMSRYPQLRDISVSRTRSLLSCYVGMSEDRLQKGRSRLVIPYGEDADRLYSYHRPLELDSSSEEEYVTPKMCCEHTRIILVWDGQSPSPADGLTLEAVGSTCGLDLETGRTMEGDFRCRLQSSGRDTMLFDMPRQSKRDIRIDAMSDSSSQVMFSIDLAGELDRAMYDWDAESLPPLVVLTVSTTELAVTVKIIDWDRAVNINCIL